MRALLSAFIAVSGASRTCWSPDDPYTGTKRQLPNGQSCQQWNTNYPSVVAHLPTEYASNYCRNPDNDPNGPWCYNSDFTADEHDKMMYCDIPKCRTSSSPPQRRRSKCGAEWNYYQGDNTKSEKGKTCLNWSDVEESASFERFQRFGIPKHNKCRNPSKDGSGPWCFVKKTVWKPRFQEKTVKEQCALDTTTKFADCDVGCIKDDGAYDGDAFVSGMGYVCQKWNTNYPNMIDNRFAHMNHNKCRNPDNDPNGPWCYIFSLSLRKASCNQIPYCSGDYQTSTSPVTKPVATTQFPAVIPQTRPRVTSATQRVTTKPTASRRMPTCGNLVYPMARSWWRQTTDMTSRYSPIKPTYQLSRSSRIYGGEKAPGMVPWLVSFVFGNENQNTMRCGASLLGPNFVVTAAHCALRQNITSIKLTGGTFSFSSDTDHAIHMEPLKVIMHPDYDERKHGNDIALIKIRKIENWSDNIRPVCLPDEDAKFDSGSLCIVSGWGATEEANVSPFSKYTVVPKLPQEICRSWLYTSVDYNEEFCAGWEQGERDSCTGDSGGPLMCRHGEQWHLYGIVSRGEGCGKPHKPGVYVNVRHFTKWIKQTARQEMRRT